MRWGLALAFGACMGACNALSGIGDLRSGDGNVALTDASIDGALSRDARAGLDGGTRPGEGGNEGPGGFLDPSFGERGIALSSLLDDARGIAVQDDGKPVVVGVKGNHLAVVRLLPDGTPDPDFGEGGRRVVTTRQGSAGNALAIDAAGRILAAGTTTAIDDAGTHNTFLVTRVTAAGAIDETFGEGGRLIGPFGGESATALAVASDATFVGGSAPGAPFVVWWVNASGALEEGFGEGGRAVVAMPGGVQLQSIAATPQSVVVAGSGTGNDTDVVVAHVATRGATPSFVSAQTSFGNGFDVPFAVAVQPDGRIVLAGETGVDDLRSPRFGVLRLGLDGKLDSQFGAGGRFSLTFPSEGEFREVDERLRGLVIDARGRTILAGGIIERTFPPQPQEFARSALVRLTPEGQLDPLFGEGGRLLFTNTQSGLAATGLALGSDGQLLVLGTVLKIGGFFVARVTP